MSQSRKMTHDDRDGRANHKHADGELAEENGSREFAFGNPRKWHHGETHEQMNREHYIKCRREVHETPQAVASSYTTEQGQYLFVPAVYLFSMSP
jgi:hypothetical protein